ncbi:long-chain fatty acid--CoA ligase [bacterium]|nr:MAG: long-chain fatty acid--CoA ligase [bacterium]
MTALHPPFRSRTLGDLVDEMAERNPCAPLACDSTGRRATYGEFAERTDRIATWFAQQGLRQGDRVALLMGNRLDWLELAVGAHKRGLTAVPMSTWLRAREIEQVLRDSGAHAIVSSERMRRNDYRELLAEVPPSAPGRDRLVFWDKAAPGIAVLERYASRTPVRASAPAFILYTSGSTAAPKGVILSHGDAIENAYNIGERMHLSADDRVFLAAPLFWSFGAVNALPALLTHGGGLVLQEAFEPGGALDLIERERCTVFYGMINMVRSLVEHPAFAPDRVASLRTGLTIGSPSNLAYTKNLLGIDRICNVYGLTETYGNCCVSDAADPDEIRFQAQGRPLPGNVLRIVDDAGVACPAGTAGSVEVRGYTAHYTSARLDAAQYTVDGFFRTGDIGFLDENGLFHFQARDNEMIKTGGINVAPAEVEEVLRLHPAVKEAYVVGVPDTIKDESVVAFIITHGKVLGAAELTPFCRTRLASYKIPSRFEMLDAAAVPLTPTGKVHRRGLRAIARRLFESVESRNAGC